MKNEDIKIVENLRYSEDTFIIRWNITKLCNYSCDFCIQGNKEKHINDSIGESNEIRKKIAEKIVVFIENSLNHQYRYLHIYLIGGEVMILKNFNEIFNILLNTNFLGDIQFHITTNLSTDIKILKELKDNFQNMKSNYSRKLSISASYYKEFANEKEFIEKVKMLHASSNITYYLASKKQHFQTKRLYDKVVFKILDAISKNKSVITVSVRYPLVEDNDYNDYRIFQKKYSKYADSIHYVIIRNYKKIISSKLKEKLSRDNNKKIKVTLKNEKNYYFSSTSKIDLLLENNKCFNPFGFSCDSGVNSLSIGNLGVVSRCPSCAKETVVGNILKDDIKLLKENMICPSQSCSCDYYHKIKNNN